MIDKPYEIKYNETKERLYSAISESYTNGISYCVLETLLKNILNDVCDVSKQELENAYKNYHNAQKMELENNAECNEEKVDE